MKMAGTSPAIIAFLINPSDQITITVVPTFTRL
jgi:hypothetical protein